MDRRISKIELEERMLNSTHVGTEVHLVMESGTRLRGVVVGLEDKMADPRAVATIITRSAGSSREDHHSVRMDRIEIVTQITIKRATVE